MHLWYIGIFNDYFITRFLLSPTVKHLKIGRYLAKLWARVGCHHCHVMFFDSRGSVITPV